MAAVNAVRPMVSYRALAIGAGPLSLGIIAASFAVMALVAAVPIGRQVDRIGENRFMLVGSALIAVDAFAILAIRTAWGLALSQAILGFGQVQTAVAAQSLLVRHGDPAGGERRLRQFTIAASVGQLVGPAAAGLLAGLGASSGAGSSHGPADAGVEAALAAAGLAATLAVALLVFLQGSLPAPSAGTATADGAGPATVRSVLGQTGMPPMLLVSMMSASVGDVLVVYLPAYALPLRLSVTLVGTLLALRAAATLGARVVMSRILARIGHGRLLTVGMIGAGLAMALVPLTSSGAAIALLMVLVGIGTGFGQPITMAWVAERAPGARRATALGVRVGANRLGQLVAPAAGGAIASLVGVPGVFVAMGLAIGVSGGLAAPIAAQGGALAEGPAEP